MQIRYILQYSLSKTTKQKALLTVHDCHCCPYTKLEPDASMQQLGLVLLL